MAWTVVAADRAGTELGEVRQAAERSVTPRPLRMLPTSSVRVRSDNWLVPYFLAMGEKVRLKWYDDSGTLRFNGPVNPSLEKVIDEQNKTVAVPASGGAILLADRLLGKTRQGDSFASVLAPQDKSELIRQVLAAANTEEATGIIEGTIGLCGSPGYYGPALLKSALDAVTEIAAPLDGPDWEVEPVEPSANAGAIGRLNTSAAFGQDRPNAVWEYGTGRHNVRSWRHVEQLDTIANRVWNAPPNWPENATQELVSASDLASRADRGLKETLVQADLAVDAFRQQLVQEHVRVRATPRQIITFEPSSELVATMRYGVDYREGDLLRFFALDRLPVYDSTGYVVQRYVEQPAVDIVARLYAVTFTLDTEGVATPQFTIVEGG